MPDEYLTTAPAARIGGWAEHTVRQKADRGELPCVRTSTGTRLFRRVDVERVAHEDARRRQRDARRSAFVAPRDPEDSAA
jgi:hypothetical protein